MKFCKDCKYCSLGPIDYECTLFKRATDLVTGAITYFKAREQRSTTGNCGVEARYYEALR